MKKSFVLVLIVVIAFLIVGCAGSAQANNEPEMVQAEAENSAEAEPEAEPITAPEEQADPNILTYTVTIEDYACPRLEEFAEIVGGNAENWRYMDDNLDDKLATEDDGCGYLLLDWSGLSLSINLPEGMILNKPTKTYGPAVIYTQNEPATVWLPDYDDGCPESGAELAVGTSDEDWTRLDANNDGQINIDDDWCGFLLTSWDTKNLKFNISAGIVVDQSDKVTGPADYSTNHLPATIWVTDFEMWLTD